MTKTARLAEKAPKTCRECQRWAEVKEKIRVHELLENAITCFEKKITENTHAPTIAEYMKLLQLQREMGQEGEVKEITVTWVGPEMVSEGVK